LFSALEKADQTDHTERAGRARGNFQEYLLSKGVLFAQGTQATLSSDGKHLNVHNTTDQLILTDTEEAQQRVQKRMEMLWREDFAAHSPKKKSRC